MPASTPVTRSNLATSRLPAFALAILTLPALLAAIPCARASKPAPVKDPALEARLRHNTQDTAQ
jgi:hypothetical protein